MKRLKNIIPLLLLALFCSSVPAAAAETDSNAIIQWTADAGQDSALLALVPTAEMTENAVTALQIIMQVTDSAQMLTDVSVTFDAEIEAAYRITDYIYHADTNELHIFLSDPKALFPESGGKLAVGTVSISTGAQEDQISIVPVSVKAASQSHTVDVIPSEELKDMGLVLTKSGGTENPGTPENPDTPDNPGTPENPDSNKIFDHAGDVAAELNNGQAAGVTYLIGKNAEISEADQKTVFQALKGKDKTVTFAVMDGDLLLYSFTFRGDQITDENVVVDFKLESGLNDKDIEKLMEKGAGNLILDFSHSGKLPGNAEVKVYTGSHFEDGQKLFLYYYNPDTKAVEPVQENIIVADGYATFELAHCSRYVLTTRKVKAAGDFPVPGEQDPSEETDGKPSGSKNGIITGDTAPTAVFILLAAAAAGVIVLVLRRKAHR